MKTKTRRDFLKLSMGMLSAGLLVRSSPAFSQTPQIPKPTQDLSSTDVLATSLGYYANAAEVDVKKWVKRAGSEGAKQNCSNCQLFVKFPGESERGGCALFMGKWVQSKGWCNGYVPLLKK